ncbi:MAG TPA: AAA family ATPase [Candidatus Nitrosotenuis sp.]|nr:AAA family ATPase [Candidatus Nitrosotenuis sp.]
MPRSLTSSEVGIPKFPINFQDLESDDFSTLSFFDLSSHSRAKQSIDFGLKMRSMGGHVFVIGGDRSGRLTATVDYLREYVKVFPPASDWVYLNNFAFPHRPIPFRLPNGQGFKLKSKMADFIEGVYEIFHKTFTNSNFVRQLNSLTHDLENDVRQEIEKVQEFAHKRGLHIESSTDEVIIHHLDENERTSKRIKTKKKPFNPKDVQAIRDELSKITIAANIRSRELHIKLVELQRVEAQRVLEPLIQPIIEEFSPYLESWLQDLATDIVTHVNDFLSDGGLDEEVANRYSVNLLVDNRHADYPNVILEPNPTYERLFGSIKYRSGRSGYETDFTLIRAGNIHRANGGILVLRAEGLANNPEVWAALKVALRDRVIRIEEHHRENAMPMLDAPEPQSIPLDLQVFIIGAPTWYYNFLYNDPEFKTYFKIKADIDPDLPATDENIRVYSRLLQQFALKDNKKRIEVEAIQYLLGYSSRWIQNRERLSARFELISDILSEACVFANEDKSELIRFEDVRSALYNRRLRNSSNEDRAHRDIESGLILIDTQGKCVGQVNGLSVLSSGDHQYGIPNRITARTYAGEEGVINIERLIEMGGPIQQKGVLILDGFLNGTFAQNYPVSCNCSITFEQSYNEVEGDSASLAELLAILSSLSGIKLRQDIAVTGSVNQYGAVQAVGGINHKIEGFFRLCHHRGLTGNQGVIIPQSNINNTVLRDEVTEAIRNKQFHIWAVDTVEEAIELLSGISAGKPDKKGHYPKQTVYGAVSRQLDRYQKAINEKY